MAAWKPSGFSVAILLVVSGVLAGCLTDGSVTRTGPDFPVVGDEEFRPRVVVALIDTGIQPYHEEFRQNVEDAYAHPSTYIPDYPTDVPSLNITLDALDLEAAQEADEGLWESAQENTMYWIPGTKFVGVIGVGTDLPGGGHGTMVASRAGGNTISIPGEDVLLVVVRVPLLLFDENPGLGVRWAADQDWIDIQSNSWGTPFMCVGPVLDPMTDWMEAFKYARDKHLVFSATHNGHGNTGTFGYPSQCQDTAGPAGVVAVGATDNDGFARWANWFPQIAADGCANPTAAEDSMEGTVNTGGGTSSATPFSAGGAAKIILEARRILRDPTTGIHDGVIATAHPGAVLPEKGPLADGNFTMDELKQVLFRTAISPPEEVDSDGDACTGTQVPIPDMTPQEPLYPLIGYGEVNHNSIDHALAVIRGEADLPERPTEDTFYQEDQELRRQMWG